MKFAEFMCVEAIRPNCDVGTKEELMCELVGALVEAGQIKSDDQADIVKAIIRREELGTTAIGSGFAIPHVKHPTIDRVVGTVGIVSGGIDFNSLDGKPTEVFFLLLSPVETPTFHLRAMEKVARHLKDEMFCRFLNQAQAAADIVELLQDADQPQFAHASA